MKIKEVVKKYLSNLIETFLKKPVKIGYTAFLMWVFIPLMLIFIFAVYRVVYEHTLDIPAIVKMFSAVIPWWFNLIITPTFINFAIMFGEYLLFFLITLILVHHKIWIPSKPN